MLWAFWVVTTLCHTIISAPHSCFDYSLVCYHTFGVPQSIGFQFMFFCCHLFSTRQTTFLMENKIVNNRDMIVARNVSYSYKDFQRITLIIVHQVKMDDCKYYHLIGKYTSSKLGVWCAEPTPRLRPAPLVVDP